MPFDQPHRRQFITLLGGAAAALRAVAGSAGDRIISARSPEEIGEPMSPVGGEFNRSLQHILRTSQPASDRARSFSAFH
jgi:hypothetical protein